MEGRKEARKICFLLPDAWGTTNADFNLKLNFPPEIFQTTHTVWVRATSLCEDIQVYQHVRENIFLLFRIRSWDKVSYCLLGLFHPYSQPIAVWGPDLKYIRIVSLRLDFPLWTNQVDFSFGAFFGGGGSPMPLKTNNQVHLIWQMPTRDHSTSLIPASI